MTEIFLLRLVHFCVGDIFNVHIKMHHLISLVEKDVILASFIIRQLLELTVT